MGKLMILGAGVYQTPIIKKAKELGHEALVISIPGDYPGFEYADKIFFKDTRDYQAILEIAQKEEIDGITTLGTDVAVRSIGYVNEHMGLYGIKENTGIETTNKRFMKEKFAKYGINTPDFRIVTTIDEAFNAFKSFPETPTVFKVVDRSGSKGVVKVSTEKEITDAYKYCIENTDKDYIIVEEFIEGTKFGLESAIVDKKPSFTLPMGDILTKSRIDIPIGHYAPYSLPEEAWNSLQAQMLRIIEAFNLDYCAVNLDVIVRNNEVFILEVGARAGGSNISDIISLVYDIDYYKFIIDLSLGKAHAFDTQPKSGAACQVLTSSKNGILKEVRIGKKDKHLIELKMDYKIGDSIRKFETGPDRIGHILIQCRLEEAPLPILENVLSHLHITVE